MAETVYSLEQIDKWKQKLDRFANEPRTRFTKKHAVEAMIEQIEKTLESHSYDEVAEHLKDWGLAISPGSLKQYVNAYRRANPSGKTGASRSRTKKRKRAATGSVKQSSDSNGKTSANSDNKLVKESADSTALGHDAQAPKKSRKTRAKREDKSTNYSSSQGVSEEVKTKR